MHNSDMHGFYVCQGLLTASHMKRIGPSAIWEFLWLISHETKMEGRVLNGSPVTLSRIAEELGEHFNTAQRNLERLCKEGYVTKKRAGKGCAYSYSIAHSKKWKLQWVGDTKNGVTSDTKNGDTPRQGDTKSGERVSPNLVSGVTKFGMTNKEDRQLDILDKRNTTCIKCGGLGKFPELVPSELDPDLKVKTWVKCECQG